MTARYPLVPVPCNHCRATRQADAVLHRSACPADGANVAFFVHPDLIELDLHGAAFYPEP